MRVEYNEDTGVYSLDSPALRFTDVVSGVGWLTENAKNQDHQKHACTCMARKEDGVYYLMGECSGTWPTITDQLIAWKDTLLVDRVYTDGSMPGMERDMRLVDGLCRYDHQGKDVLGKLQYVSRLPYETWETFRDRQTVASVIPVPLHMRGDGESAIGCLERLGKEKRLQVKNTLSATMQLLSQTFDSQEIREDPLIWAISWPIYMLENSKPKGSRSKEWVNPFPNF
jgi:hypothetical protein